MESEFDLREGNKQQLTNASRHLVSTIKRRFMFGLVLIIGMLTLIFSLAELALYQQSLDNQRIRATLAQQHLNQEILSATKQLLVTQDLQARRVLLAQLKEAAEEFNYQQNLVMKKHFFIVEMPAPQRAIYSDSPHKLDQRVKDFAQAVEQLSSTSYEQITANTPQAAVILEESPGHLSTALRVAVAAHLDSKEKMDVFYMQICAVIWVLLTVLVVWLGLFIIRPGYLALSKALMTFVNGIEQIQHDWRLEKAMREHFKDEAVQLKLVVNTLEKIIIATAVDGTIKSLNAFAEQKLGFSEAEVVGQRSIELFHDPEDLQSRANALSDIYQTQVSAGFDTLTAKAKHGDIDDYAWLLRSKNGQLLRVRLNYRAIVDGNGETIGFLAEGDLN